MVAGKPQAAVPISAAEAKRLKQLGPLRQVISICLFVVVVAAVFTGDPTVDAVSATVVAAAAACADYIRRYLRCYFYDRV